MEKIIYASAPKPRCLAPTRLVSLLSRAVAQSTPDALSESDGDPRVGCGGKEPRFVREQRYGAGPLRRRRGKAGSTQEPRPHFCVGPVVGPARPVDDRAA